MHCRLLLLFTFYSNTTNSDTITLFGTFLIKIRQKRARIIKGWFKYMTASLKNTRTSNVSFVSQKLLKIANVNKLSKDILNRISDTKTEQK
jgi:hypothetical protein